MVMATLRRDLLTTQGWSYSALIQKMKNFQLAKETKREEKWYILDLPPIVHNDLEFGVLLLDFFKPFTTVLITTFNIIDICVREHNVENRKDKHERADECLFLEPISGEERHHAALVADNDKKGRVCRSFNHVALRIDLLSIHVEQVQTVYKMSQ